MLFLILSKGQGHEITLKIKDLKNKEVILGHYFAERKNTMIDDTIRLNDKGIGVLKGNKPLKQGMYFLYYPGMINEIIIGKEQKFIIETDTADFYGNLKITGSKENEIFLSYQKERFKNIEKDKELREKFKTAKGKEKEKITEEMKKSGEKMKKLSDDIIEKNPDLFFSKFLKATYDVKTPDEFLDKNGKFIDSLYFKYMKYYQKHYFDNFDYTDIRLLRTLIYDRKMKKYIEIVERQNPIDTIKIILDGLLEKSKKDDELYRYMLVSIFNHFASSQIMCMDEVFVHLAKNYYIPDAKWSDKTYIEKLKGQIARKKYIFCGNKTQDLKMQNLPKTKEGIAKLREALKKTKTRGEKAQKEYDAKKKAGTATKQDSTKMNNEFFYAFEEYENNNFGEYISLHQIDKDYTILWFWEPSCSHCSKATPMLGEMYHKIKDLGVEVYCVFIQAFIADWNKFMKHTDGWYKFIQDYNLHEWINTWDVHHYTRFRDFYDISGTPVIFLLDKEKKIIAKRLSVGQCENILIERFAREAVKGKKGSQKIAAVENMISDKFTLAEIVSLEKISNFIFEDKEKEKMNKIIIKHKKRIQSAFDAKFKKFAAIKDEKQRTKEIHEYVDKIWNKADLTYLKNGATKVLSGSYKTKIDKYIDTRIKYKLE